MSAHENCHAVGKYDCHYDSWVHGDLIGDGGADEEFGDVTDYGVWSGKLDLDPTASSDECETVEHYGGAYLLIQENSQGFVYVHAFETDALRNQQFELLRQTYDEWDDPDFDDTRVYVAGDWRRG